MAADSGPGVGGVVESSLQDLAGDFAVLTQDAQTKNVSAYDRDSLLATGDMQTLLTECEPD